MPKCIEEGTHTGCKFHYENGQNSDALHCPDDLCRRYPPRMVMDIHHRGDTIKAFFPPIPEAQWCGEWIKDGE